MYSSAVRRVSRSLSRLAVHGERLRVKLARFGNRSHPYGPPRLPDPSQPVTVAVTNFWDGFDPESGFVKVLLDRAFGSWRVIDSPRRADIVLTSVFPHVGTAYPAKTVAIIWENHRPCYECYHWSLSCDFEDHGGRNVRLPQWTSTLMWRDGVRQPPISCGGAHGHEDSLDIDVLMRRREGPRPARGRFCGFVARNPVAFRMAAAEALSAIAPVDLYGPITGRPDPRSKFEILADHDFSLCFENSVHPGYHTEKVLHAWAAGTIPLYWGAESVGRDFNPAAFVNRIDFPDTESFVAHVRALAADPDRIEAMWREPILLDRPDLGPAIDLLAGVLETARAGRTPGRTI